MIFHAIKTVKILCLNPTLTKIVRKSWEKDRKPSPTLPKWEYFCQNWWIIRQFWQKYSHPEKTGENFLSLSSNFPMIFVSVHFVWRPCRNINRLSYMNIFLLRGGGFGPQSIINNHNWQMIDIHALPLTLYTIWSGKFVCNGKITLF